jgi:transcription elongation factor Elf1
MSNNQTNPTSCSNCGTAYTCSCQVKIASDGKKVCNNCHASYELNLQTLRDRINDIKQS